MSTTGCGIKDVPAGGRILAAGASLWSGMRASLPCLVACSSSCSAYHSGVDDPIGISPAAHWSSTQKPPASPVARHFVVPPVKCQRLALVRHRGLGHLDDAQSPLAWGWHGGSVPSRDGLSVTAPDGALTANVAVDGSPPRVTRRPRRRRQAPIATPAVHRGAPWSPARFFLNRVSQVRFLPGAQQHCRVPGDAGRSPSPWPRQDLPTPAARKLSRSLARQPRLK